jgi:transcriptional regulator with XRE-family HTH domain
MLSNVQGDINEIMSEIQKILDEETGIGLNAIRPNFPEGRIKGLIDKLTARGFPEDVERWLGEPIVNNSEAFADDFIRENAKFRADAGMKATITRKTAFKCCDYCAALAGSYIYGTEPKEIYSRHEFCRCIVTYKTEKGKSQDVWSKQKWKSQPEEIEKRKTFSQETISPRERIERLERLERDEILQEFSKKTNLPIKEVKKKTKGLSSEDIRKKLVKLLAEGEEIE